MTAEEVREVEASESRARARAWRTLVVWTALILLLGAGALYGPAVWRGLRLAWMRRQFERKWKRRTTDTVIVNAPLCEVTYYIAIAGDINIIFVSDWELDKKPVNVKKGATLKEAITEVTKQGGLEHRMRYPNTLIIYKPDSREIERFDAGGLRWGRGSADVRRALRKEVSVEFVEQPIDECIQYLQGFQRTNCRAMWGDNCDPKTPVTLRLSRVPLAEAWDCMLRVSGMVGEVRDGKLIIRPIDPLPGQ